MVYSHTCTNTHMSTFNQKKNTRQRSLHMNKRDQDANKTDVQMADTLVHPSYMSNISDMKT